MYIKEEQHFKHWLIGILFVVITLFLLVTLKSILWPFITSAIFAYLLSPLAFKLEKKIKRRDLSIFIVLFSTYLLTAIIIIAVIPLMIQQLSNFFSLVPKFINIIDYYVIKNIESYFNVNINFNSFVRDYIKANPEDIKQIVTRVFYLLEKNSGGAFNLVIGLILIPFLLYYFLTDWTLWKQKFFQLIPRRFQRNVIRILLEINRVMMEFLKGQVTVMIIMSMIFGIGLSAVGLDNGFLIGVVSGLIVFIPYIGTFIGFLMAFLTAIIQFDNIYNIIAVLVVFIVGHLLESLYITPKLVGNRIGVSPLLVIFALLSFGKILGFIGILLALPLASIVSVLFKELIDYYLNSGLYNNLK